MQPLKLNLGDIITALECPIYQLRQAPSWRVISIVSPAPTVMYTFCTIKNGRRGVITLSAGLIDTYVGHSIHVLEDLTRIPTQENPLC